MKTLWDFIVKHEFWFSCLVVIGLWIAEDQTGQWWDRFSRNSCARHCDNASRISSYVEEG